MKWIATLSLTMLFAASLFAQNFCNSTANIVLFTNYDGGTLNINIDQNISNIKLGIVSYEAVDINISGTYAGNITEVRYAGYNSSNTNCTPNVSTTSISGAGSATTSITFAPSATLSNSNGYGSIICGYSCSTTSSQGGCNTVDQIEHYFLQQFSNAQIHSHSVQYGCWSGTQNMSDGGDCCALSIPLSASATATNETCVGVCDGTITTNVGGGQSPYAYLWSTGATTNGLTDLCPGTYTVTVTDDAGDTETASATIDTADSVLVLQSFMLCDGEEVTVGSNTYNATGVFIDTLLSVGGCDSIVTTDLFVYPAYSSNQSFSATECDDFSVTVGPNTYTSSGAYTDTLVSSTGCDSIVYTTINIFAGILITNQPADASVTENNPVQFSVTSDTSAQLQWQEDAGTGFVDLSNAGIFSGVTTSTLALSTTQLSMNNYNYRCIATKTECTDTSDAAVLTVKKSVGIENKIVENGFVVYPNPAHNTLTLSFNKAPGCNAYLVDELGRIILTTFVQKSNITLDVSELSNGNYTLTFEDQSLSAKRIQISH